MEPSSTNPFRKWEDALSLDVKGHIKDSGSAFARASQSFYEFGSNNWQAVGRACFEYSTLMDSFSRIQEARLMRLESQFEQSLGIFGEASEILRATVHFGFLSAFESACATLETANELKDKNAQFEAFRNAIALLEQSKLALGLRDELHPTIRVIDSILKYSISRALLAESGFLADEGKLEESRNKLDQSEKVKEDYFKLSGRKWKSVNYFPLNDWERAKKGGFMISFPENQSMWIGNIGSNPVILESAGAAEVNEVVDSFKSILVPTIKLGKGRLRISYRDLKNGTAYNEGCVLMV